jgi:hypothetical protein
VALSGSDDAGLDALRNLQEKFSYFPRLLNGRSCDLLRRAAEPFELAMRRLSALPQTLVNGDVNLNKFIFPRDRRGEAAIAVLIDLSVGAEISRPRFADRPAFDAVLIRRRHLVSCGGAR